MIKAIFIDIDNTLLDFDAYVRQALENGFAKFGLGTYEPWMYDTFTRLNNELWQRLERKEIDLDELRRIRFGIIFKELGIDYDGVAFEEFFRRELNESTIPVEGAYELLEALSGRFVLCAASNGPYLQQVHRMELADMKKYFAHLFISEEIGYSKPATEFFEVAMRRLNENRTEAILPDECLMLGDSLSSDIAGGRNAGMKTCYYTRGNNAVSDPRVDYCVEDLMQVLDCDFMRNE